MKILIVRTFPDILDINSYNVQEIGLAKALTVKGHQCDIILFGGKQKDHKEILSFEKNKESHQVTIYWLKGYRILKNGYMPALESQLAGYDIIQVHEYDQIQSFLTCKRSEVPVIIYQGPYYHPYARGYNLRCRLFDLLFMHGDSYKKVPALTKSLLAKEFLENKGFGNVRSVGVGLDEDKFEKRLPGDKLIPDRENDTFRLLYIGKIEERRNVYFLVDVLRRLNESGSKKQLVIVGSGEENYTRKFLLSIEKELKDGTILYCPKAAQAQLADIYQNADLFLLTSNYEIFGMVLLEAMYFGIPVVSSRNGGSVTLISEGVNGYVIDGFRKDEWGQKISLLLSDRGRLKAMGQKAQALIKEKYLWSRLSDQFIDAYRKAIDSKEGR